ncbi:MAG: hypothetical protein ABFD70_04950 [Syntrophaceae bacterium]|nr:hypothetical protein [Deltaproteobacteria bacterium]
MKKLMPTLITTLCALSCFLVPSLSFAMEVSLDITGPQELSSLKTAIEKSIVARSVAKGVPLEKFGKLSVTISKLGNVISYDALLDTSPPKAFHKDLKDASTLSGTIDEMIGALFAGAGNTQVPPVATPMAPPKAKVADAHKVKLAFVATSIASVGGKVYVSDKGTVYEIKGEEASPVWRAPGKTEILRISSFKDTLIVLAKLVQEFRTFSIRDGKTVERWDRAVVPIGQGLVSTNIRADKDLSGDTYRWSAPMPLTGTPPEIPQGFDTLSAIVSQTNLPARDPEIFSYNRENRLAVSIGDSIPWTADTDAGITPSFVEDAKIVPPIRYYLKPRIVASGGKIITFKNEQGLGKMLTRMNLFDSSRILVYTRAGEEFTEAEAATFPASYCPDIALAGGKVAALIVKGKYSYLQFLDI